MPAKSERRQPTALTLRTYRVGFGDCFLLTFHYPDEARHVLIDCGTVAFPRSHTAKGRPPMLRVVEDIRDQCGGKLHAVIVTHRHRDHLSGFKPRKDGRGPGDILKACDPDVVLQPWTEDPALAAGAAAPGSPRTPGSHQTARAFTRALSDMHRVAAAALAETKRMRADVQKNIRQQLEFLGEDNLRNDAAVRNLMTMGRRHVYAHAGSDAGLARVLPGVTVHVLGPPTLEQAGDLHRARAVDQAEFWHLQALSSAPSTRRPRALFKGALDLRTHAAPPQVRWFIPRVRNLRGESLLDLVRVLDGAMNNTSLVLLFEVGGKKLLFPGDAQIESWEYALRRAENREEVKRLLADVHVYKVGHHGSLNATPKSLWRLFRHRSPARGAGRLISLLSTLPGKHGRKERGTEVPREALLKELERHSELVSTHALRGRTLRHHLIIPL
ncbi:MAG: hypothetical protein IRZ16_15775 [Myxococcaceae bacterium]|nr:hypothetical protein [Myxococcaceae bacterium]